MQIKIHTPVEIILPLAKTLEGYGATIEYKSPSSGLVIHQSGVMEFSHDGQCLIVTIVSHEGHFPVKLLIGGIRQLIEETMEIHKKEGA